ncbi:MAG: cytochrome c biogenesis protein CcsA [Planctomycetota bacterium]|nr:cytochrome c biogenesis protein CcsA [Planctomycetota bacterium]
MTRVLSVLAGVLVVLGGWARAGAQTAPDGNAHPPTQGVNAGGAAVGHPFGRPSADDVPTRDEKWAFAEQVDVGALRDLAVFHNGRVKIIDTLARETVRSITGRATYREDYRNERSGETTDGLGGPVKIISRTYDPVFTLFDLTIDPAYYLDKPLIGVDYLPLRRELVEMAYPDDADARERWLKLGRVTPRVVESFLGELSRRHMGEDAWRRAQDRVDRSVGWFIGGRSNFELVAPERRDLAWMHIASLDDTHPARAAALELGAAWRARDAGRVNEAIARLAAELPRINAEVYPQGRRTLERTYNRVNAFEWGFWAYFVALVSLVLAFGTGRVWPARIGTGMLVLGLGLHAFGFVARCMIAERFAIQNQFESMTGLSLFGVIVGGGIMLARRAYLFGAAAAAVGFMVLVTATQAKIPGVSIEREAAILNTSVLLKYHVTTVLSSYALIALGFVVSIFYLATHYLGALRSAPAAGGGGAGTPALAGLDGEGAALALGATDVRTPTRERVLGDLDSAQMIVLQLAFWTLGVGILLGAWWADHSWGRWWAFDPKETWALITWIIYLIVIHVRIGFPRGKGLTTAWLSVIGFIIMLWTYFGVNLMLPGLHAYA